MPVFTHTLFFKIIRGIATSVFIKYSGNNTTLIYYLLLNFIWEGNFFFFKWKKKKKRGENKDRTSLT